MLLSQLSISVWAHVVKREKWGVYLKWEEVTKKNPNGHAMIVTEPWMGERVNFFVNES